LIGTWFFCQAVFLTWISVFLGHKFRLALLASVLQADVLVLCSTTNLIGSIFFIFNLIFTSIPLVTQFSSQTFLQVHAVVIVLSAFFIPASVVAFGLSAHILFKRANQLRTIDRTLYTKRVVSAGLGFGLFVSAVHAALGYLAQKGFLFIFVSFMCFICGRIFFRLRKLAIGKSAAPLGDSTANTSSTTIKPLDTSRFLMLQLTRVTQRACIFITIVSVSSGIGGIIWIIGRYTENLPLLRWGTPLPTVLYLSAITVIQAELAWTISQMLSNRVHNPTPRSARQSMLNAQHSSMHSRSTVSVWRRVERSISAMSMRGKIQTWQEQQRQLARETNAKQIEVATRNQNGNNNSSDNDEVPRESMLNPLNLQEIEEDAYQSSQIMTSPSAQDDDGTLSCYNRPDSPPPPPALQPGADSVQANEPDVDSIVPNDPQPPPTCSPVSQDISSVIIAAIAAEATPPNPVSARGDMSTTEQQRVEAMQVEALGELATTPPPSPPEVSPDYLPFSSNATNDMDSQNYSLS
jgi:hypothetical protein